MLRRLAEFAAHPGGQFVIMTCLVVFLAALVCWFRIEWAQRAADTASGVLFGMVMAHRRRAEATTNATNSDGPR